LLPAHLRVPSPRSGATLLHQIVQARIQETTWNGPCACTGFVASRQFVYSKEIINNSDEIVNTVELFYNRIQINRTR